MDGFSSGKEEDKLGICGSSTTPLYMDNVKVPAENILGEIGGGFKIAMEVLNTGRLGLAASFVGAAKSLTPHAIKFVTQREQFRKKISDFEIIKEKFSRIMINTFTSESMVYYATYLEDLPGIPFAVEAAICKAFSSEALWQTINDCLQAAGGNGFMKEYPYERFLRDARINLIFEGTNEIQRMFIALSGLRMLSVKLKKYQKELSENPDEREKQIDEIYRELYSNGNDYALDGFSDKLDKLISTAGKLAHKLNETSVKTVLRNGRDIKEKQYIQRRLADAAMDIYGIFANIARVENLIRKSHKSADDALLISEMFAYQAESRVMQNLNEVSSNRDEALTKMAHMLFDSEKYPFEIMDY
jgi:acyl-CoA dehydrogenase family protein 9